MPTATEGDRRGALQRLCALVAGTVMPLGPAAAAGGASGPGAAQDPDAPAHPALAASWQEDNRHFIGVLAPEAGSFATLCRHEVPSRAHGLAVEADGSILVSARRPGDWLLRFDPRRRAVREWSWSNGEHSFNGHVIASADGRRLFTTETSLETGEGSVAVRNARSLVLLARWLTAGRDPHELVLAPDGALWVANGGIETRPETGRTKHRLDRMDSSLVRLEPTRGRMTGQWRLGDGRLGMRHLAIAGGGTLAIALQAEHEDPVARRSAPVLALWDSRQGLRAVSLPMGEHLAGYGGSVAASGGDIAVSCPRAGTVARWRMVGSEARWQEPLQLPEACALAAGWLGGEDWVLRAASAPPDEGAGRGVPSVTREPGGDTERMRWRLPAGVRLDNHWSAMDAAVAEAPRSG